jgi:hypothetical protein
VSKRRRKLTRSVVNPSDAEGVMKGWQQNALSLNVFSLPARNCKLAYSWGTGDEGLGALSFVVLAGLWSKTRPAIHRALSC